MVHRIYTAKLQLNTANASDSEAAFLDLNLSINNDTVSTKIYDKRDDFDFDIVNFPVLDGDVPLIVYMHVYIIYIYIIKEMILILILLTSRCSMAMSLL